MPALLWVLAFRSDLYKNAAGYTVRRLPQRGRHSMRRKPDLLWVLVILFGLGVVTTGYTQSLWDRQADTSVSESQQS